MGSNITVNYTITNEVRGKHFSYSTEVEVPAGSVLLVVLEEAQKSNKTIFR